MRATLFHNPAAGQKTDKDDILAAMKLADFDVHYVSVKNGDVEKALEKRTDLIVIAGGDGTIAEVVTKLPNRSVPIALFPLGTANNIARSLGIAGTPQELVETWKIDNTHPLDIGLVKASWGVSRFVEGFGVGLFADFLRAADKRDKPKGADNLRKGRALLEKWIKSAEPIEVSIKIDGRSLHGDFLGVEVMNVRKHKSPMECSTSSALRIISVANSKSGSTHRSTSRRLSRRGKGRPSSLPGPTLPIASTTNPTAIGTRNRLPTYLVKRINCGCFSR